MSQVRYFCTLNDTPIEVLAGWDHPLKYFFLTIFKIADDSLIFDCLDDPNCFDNKTTDAFKKVVTDLNITVPDDFWELVERKEKNIIHKWKDNKWHSYA